MAEFLWTFAVQEVLKNVVKLAAEQIGLAWGFEEELSKLSKELLKAEAILREINTRKLHHDSVRMWVEDLQHLVYQADDLLDDVVYEHLRQKAQTARMNKVRDFVSPSNNAFIFRRKMAKKMKNVLDSVHKHYCEAAPLGLVGNASVEPDIDLISQFLETISELDDHEVVGRDSVVQSIVKQVIDASNQQVTSILPIVGMGGLGKTTLAKLVFNHEMVREHFDKTVWVCVSEPFIVNKILGEILENLKGTSHGLDKKEVLLHELQKEMHGKRYFLVLDDVWNEHASLWNELKYCLMRMTGNSENSIVVTTRSANVAKIMETLPSHHLSKLSDDQCWSLFKVSAGAYGLPMTSSLEVIQKELVKKIGGVPLVARVLGKAVRFEGDDERWVKTLGSVVRTPIQEENFVLSILKLSVDRLPLSSLKQCFAYCSNFPKDFKFKKKRLVQMWMAQGFIQLQEGRSDLKMEDIGDMYFSILLSRCLFQDAFKDDQGRIISCKMHDLIHDIACGVSSDQKLQLNPDNLFNEELWTKGSEKVVSKLRTIFCDRVTFNRREKLIVDKFNNFISLRVLIMEMGAKANRKLPKSLGKLKHLRYLKISCHELKKLPKSIVLLYNLQTLKIKTMTSIEDLPKDLRKLVNLRHLKLPFPAKKMPSCLSQLTQLQTLSRFVVGLEKGCTITELGPLKNLKGSLELFSLDQVQSKEEARTANLMDKDKLDELAFNWSFNRKHNSHNDLEVLEGLQPHKNLQSLAISGFTGKCLPNKTFVENLRAIHLFDCDNCERLPMLGQLNNLKELRIYSLKSVQRIGHEFYGNDSNQRTFFPKLEKFRLKGMSNLEQWQEIKVASNATIFPHLKEMEIEGCPKLLNIPDLFGSCDENDVEHLRSLCILRCDQLTKLPNGLQFCRSIQRLKIDNASNLSLNLENKHKLSYLSIGFLQNKLPEELAHLTNLRSIKICGCIKNHDLSPFMHLLSLRDLCLVDGLNSVTQLPQPLQHLTALEVLSLQQFDSIEALPEWLGKLVSLKTLSLSSCKNLKQLPSTEAMLNLTKLSHLYVYGCPQLQLGKGDTEQAKLSPLSKICDFSFYVDFDSLIKYKN